MLKKFMDIGIPSQMTMKKNPHHLQITRRWFEVRHIFLAPIVIFWDAILFFIYIKIFSAPKIDITGALFPLLHVSIGIALTYFLIASLFNKTIISATSHVISVKHSPIPFWGGKRLASKELLQLYCKKEDFWNYFHWYSTFSVQAIMTDRSNITLISGLNTAEQVLFIEQEIENFLNIVDKPVKGEIG